MRRAEHMTRSPVLSCGSCRCHQRQQLVRHEHAAEPALLEPAHRLVYAPGRDRVQRDSYHPRARVRSRPVGIRDGGRARSSARRDLCRPLLALVLLRLDGTHEEQVAFKERAAQMVGQSCDANGRKAPLPNKDVVPAGEPMVKPAAEVSPRCIAAQERAKEMISPVSTRTRAQELELKQRVNEMLVGSCGTAK